MTILERVNNLIERCQGDDRSVALLNELYEKIKPMQAQRDEALSIAADLRKDVAYYSDLLAKTAQHLGPEVHTDDAGGWVTEPLLSRVPELVERLARREAELMMQRNTTEPA